jgi:imidazolonepropionase-like amidohydrolase
MNLTAANVIAWMVTMNNSASIHKLTSRLAGWLVASLLFTAASVFGETFLLQNAIIHTVSGATITNGSVLINDGKIKTVLDGTKSIDTTEKVIDLKGQHLYPGMIDLDSSLGLTEIESVRGTEDTTEVGDFTPDVQSWIAVNPSSELIAVTRANGVTPVEPTPNGGVVAGVSSLMALNGWTTEDMTIKRLAALHVYWPEMQLDTTPKEKFRDKSKFKSLEDQAKEREKKLKALEDFFQESRAYAKARAVKAGEKPGINPPYEAMLPALRGEIPIMVHAIEIRQIKAAVKWAQSNDFKIILVGGRDAWQVADVIAAAKMPVVFESTFHLPANDVEGYDVHFRSPELLRKAGVKVVLSMGLGNGAASLAKNLPYDASQSVAFGFPEDEALKSVTLYPAQLMGVADRLGSIEAGKEATLFVCDGNILDIRAHVTRLWIAGREISLETRHTRLYEKYKNRPLPK